MPKILLIEDNEQNRYLVTYLLTRAGFTVVSAPNGEEGLAAAETEDPDLILLDIQLPDIDGYQLATRFRGHPRFTQLPIVAVSSFAMPGDVQKALAAGFSHYLEKPIDPETFVEEVRAALLTPRSRTA